MTPGTSAPATDGMVKVNGAELYHEIRGSGPSLLLIHGTGGDAGCYDGLAEQLATGFTVLTYDRRGWSRSPRPAGWERTSIEEQADDAAGLLRATGMAPAIVFGSSSGGLIALDLAVRHPDVVQAAVVHEPSTFAFLPPDFVQAQFAEATAIMERGFAAGGPQGGMGAFLNELAGHDGLGSVDPKLRERWLANSDLYFAIEFPHMILAYRPNPSGLTVALTVARAEESQPINAAAAEWLATAAKTTLEIIPGAHLAYLIDPAGFAAALRPLLGAS